jgi:hypothetical protein
MGLRFGAGSAVGPAHPHPGRARRERGQDRCADLPPEEGEAKKNCGGFAFWRVLRASSLRLCLLTSWPTDVADLTAMNKRSYPKPLAELVSVCVADVFERQGFTSCEIVTHWDDIVGPEIAALAEPIRMQWLRTRDPDEAPPATLILRVDGPAALEIAHMRAVILERVNRYLGWQAVDKVALRQAPLTDRRRPPRPKIDDRAAAAIAAQMTGIADDRLRTALGRLGAAIKRT